MQDLKPLLGKHIADATKADDAFYKSLNSSKAATTPLLTIQQHTSSSIRSFQKIETDFSTIQDKVEKEHSVVTTEALQKVYSDCITRLGKVRDGHGNLMDNAWEAWRDAMVGILQADNALKQHDSVLNELESIQDPGLSGDSTKELEGVRSALRRQNEGLHRKLVSKTQVLQNTLRGIPIKLREYKEKWERVYDAITMASHTARMKIRDRHGEAVNPIWP